MVNEFVSISVVEYPKSDIKQEIVPSRNQIRKMLEASGQSTTKQNVDEYENLYKEEAKQMPIMNGIKLLMKWFTQFINISQTPARAFKYCSIEKHPETLGEEVKDKVLFHVSLSFSNPANYPWFENSGAKALVEKMDYTTYCKECVMPLGKHKETKIEEVAKSFKAYVLYVSSVTNQYYIYAPDGYLVKKGIGTIARKDYAKILDDDYTAWKMRIDLNTGLE